MTLNQSSLENHSDEHSLFYAKTFSDHSGIPDNRGYTLLLAQCSHSWAELDVGRPFFAKCKTKAM